MIEYNIFYNYVYLDPRKPGDYNYGDLHFDFEPFYIGKGSNDRMYAHLNGAKVNAYNLKKFNRIRKIINETNENPIILKIYENLDEKTSLENEMYLIKIIGRNDLKLGPLTNLTDGGDGVSGPCYLKMKPVLQFDLFGNFIKEYSSIKDAMNETSIINIKYNCYSAHKKIPRYTAGGYIWRFKSDFIEVPQKIDVTFLKNKIHNGHTPRAILLYDINDNFIKEYSSIKEGSIDTGCLSSHIVSVAKGHKKHTKNFIWKYK